MRQCCLAASFLTDTCSFASQERQEMMDDLNKELRQCNLQQFIQQTGVLPVHTHSRTDLQEQLEQFDFTHLLQDGYKNGSKKTNKSTFQNKNFTVGF